MKRQWKTVCWAGAALVLGVLSGGCSTDISHAASGSSTTAQPTDPFAGVAVPTAVGRSDVSLTWEGEERDVILEIPPGFDPAQASALLLVFHGGGSSAATMYNNRRTLRELASARQVITVFPQGTGSGSSYGWNWADLPTNTADDVGFITAVISWLEGPLSVDAQRIYTAGFSAGGGMSQRMAAERPDLIAAAAAVCMSTSFLISNPTSASCPSRRRSCAAPPVEGVETRRFGIGEPTAPVPVFLVRGGQDPSVCPDGTCSRTGRRYDTAEEQVGKWLTNNGCDATDVDQSALTGRDGNQATLRRFESCTSGDPVHALYMPALEHSWPNAANETILDFLLQAELD